jgi:hypothetical protein
MTWRAYVPKSVKRLHARMRNMHPDAKFLGPVRGRDECIEPLHHPLLHVGRERLLEPMVRYLNLLHEILERHAPEKLDAVLEYGTGNSTSYLYELCRDRGATLLLSLDNYGPYQEAFRKRLPQGNFLRLETVDLQSHGDGREQDRWNFATYPMSLNRAFDLIFIDARRRNECLLVASEILSGDGIAIVHDASRIRYAPGFRLLEEVAWYPKCNGFRVLRKKRSR